MRQNRTWLTILRHSNFVGQVDGVERMIDFATASCDFHCNVALRDTRLERHRDRGDERGQPVHKIVSEKERRDTPATALR
jgi:hypothetical protein